MWCACVVCVRVCVRACVCLYKAAVRAGLEYACAVWHTSLSTEQSSQTERQQKRALIIIYPNASYDEALTLSGLETLHARRERIAQNFFNEVLSQEHRLHHLLPEPRDVRYDLRAVRTYELQRLRTWWAKNSLIHYSTIHWQ